MNEVRGRSNALVSTYGGGRSRKRYYENRQKNGKKEHSRSRSYWHFKLWNMELCQRIGSARDELMKKNIVIE